MYNFLYHKNKRLIFILNLPPNVDINLINENTIEDLVKTLSPKDYTEYQSFENYQGNLLVAYDIRFNRGIQNLSSIICYLNYDSRDLILEYKDYKWIHHILLKANTSNLNIVKLDSINILSAINSVETVIAEPDTDIITHSSQTSFNINKPSFSNYTNQTNVITQIVSSKFKSDTNAIKSTIDILKSKYGFKGLWHFTYFTNLNSIFNNNKLYSRNYFLDNGINFIDGASPSVLSKAAKIVKDYTRFYYRPKTPTLFDNEGIKPIQYQSNTHVPTPVYLLFTEELMYHSNTYFSDGNSTKYQLIIHLNFLD